MAKANRTSRGFFAKTGNSSSKAGQAKKIAAGSFKKVGGSGMAFDLRLIGQTSKTRFVWIQTLGLHRPIAGRATSGWRGLLALPIVDGCIPARPTKMRIELAHNVALSRVEARPRFFRFGVGDGKRLESSDCEKCRDEPGC
jgi:hypothetical protein